ncbi:acyl-CoA thioesterase [Hydrocarboniphaga sp.]|uniref:acyl-CoA thioesterase n=1 Tax=Hydrocarboniphaga sp. TaxID=2033016 RepID=UPI003D0DE153
MRIDRRRLQRPGFVFACEIQTRFADVDKIGHVNNVAIASIFQEGRNRFIHASGIYPLAQCDLVVASASFEYAGDLFHPEPIEIAVGVIEIGRSSLRIGQIACQHGRIGAYAEVVQVARDANGAIALPQAWRAPLEAQKIIVA